MLNTNVPSLSLEELAEKRPDAQALLTHLAEAQDSLAPEVRKAAVFIVENPTLVGVSSVRELAAAAGVKPNTLVRLAHCCGYGGFDDFRTPFRDEIRQGATFPDRARWLQAMAQDDALGTLWGEMATGVLTNVEQTLAGVDVPRLRAAAKAIVEARRTYVMGVGINYGVARSFAYLAAMVLDQVQAIPQEGHWAVDDLSEASGGDVLVALTFKPYRREVLEAVAIAKDQGVDIIGLSDSPASPLVANAEHGLVVATETPQFFTSTVAASALLETLMAFVIAAASPEAIARIERLQARRRALGLYRDDEGG